MTRLDVGSPYVLFSGNVAVGKSTIARLYAERHGFEYIAEPVERLTFVNDFFTDMKRWAFHHQLDFLIMNGELERIAMGGRGICRDRSLDENLYVFALQCHEDGWISDKEWMLLASLYTLLSENARRPDVVVFLTAPIPVLVERIASRGRSHEANLNVEWLERLADTYARWIANVSGPVLHINTAQDDLMADESKREEVLARIDSILSARGRGSDHAR